MHSPLTGQGRACEIGGTAQNVPVMQKGKTLKPRQFLSPLVLAALMLPILICVLLGIGRLLAAMNDQAGAAVLDRLALAGGIVWVVALVLLLITLAIDALSPPNDPSSGQ